MGPLPFKRELRWIWSSFRGQNFNKWKENKGGQFTIGKILLNYFQFSSVTQSCLTLCDPMDCSTPDFPVHNQLLELAHTHVHQVSDAIQQSHPLSSPSPAFNISQHQGLFQSVNSSHQVAKVLGFHWRREWQTTSVFLPWEPHEKNEKNYFISS